MSDTDRELVELRREIVEARNQAIKTDNQVKNLSLDIKGFEKRFDGLERRTRISGLGVHAIVAVTIVAATYMVHSVRVRSLTQELAKSSADSEQAKQEAGKAAEAARQKLAAVEQERTRRERSAANAVKLVDHLDKGREKEATDLLESVDLAALTPLESRLLDKRVTELRAKAAETAYRAARAAQAQTRPDVAVAEFRKCVGFEPEGRYANLARYLLATQLWTLKRHDEAEPVLREVLKRDSDKGVLEEARFLLATSLASLGKRDEAKKAFADIVQRGGHYLVAAREQQKALEGTGEITEAARATAPAAAVPAATAAPTPAAPAAPKPQ